MMMLVVELHIYDLLVPPKDLDSQKSIDLHLGLRVTLFFLAVAGFLFTSRLKPLTQMCSATGSTVAHGSTLPNYMK